ncbi:MAG: hypothetical protein IPI67_36325 [Myxococcales bacterium]|nr:hypothetical protein [Myxococcales bacterium]
MATAKKRGASAKTKPKKPKTSVDSPAAAEPSTPKARRKAGGAGRGTTTAISSVPPRRDSGAPPAMPASKRVSSVPPAPSRGRVSSAPPAPTRRSSTRPPLPPHEPRARREPWPSEWLAENHDVAAAQDTMLMAYWIADQLGDPALSEATRAQLRAAVQAAAPILRRASEGLHAFSVASAVRRNGAIMGGAQRSESARVRRGAVLDALLEAQVDGAVHATITEVSVHSPHVAAWLEELERRGRPELRNALAECGADTPGAGGAGVSTEAALRRLLAVVLLATEPLGRGTRH